MALAQVEKKYMTLLPPRRNAVGAAATGATAASVDISALSKVCQAIWIQAETSDLYILTADTAAHAEALDETATGAIGASAVTCMFLPTSLGPVKFHLELGTDLFLGYKVASGGSAGKIRYWPASGQSNG